MKKLGRIALLALVLVLATAAAVSADELEGTGKVHAIGAGVAILNGSGTVQIVGAGIGTVRVRNAETLRAQGRGVRRDLPDGSVLFIGWAGHIAASGHELTVRMAGGIIEFSATGNGSVWLKGPGHYWVNGQPGGWTPEGITVSC